MLAWFFFSFQLGKNDPSKGMCKDIWDRNNKPAPSQGAMFIWTCDDAIQINTLGFLYFSNSHSTDTLEKWVSTVAMFSVEKWFSF